ncbi:MAG TPA: zinc ribbon domain-containing protein [Planctomycetota bacterium]|nr:zinc ribbon domain-containing protein [Planctomycetota bacterium]
MDCPHCGAPVPRNARACPECGSDDQTGWASPEDQDYNEVEIPDAYDPDLWEQEGKRREGRDAAKVVIAILIALALAGLLGVLLRAR